MKRTITILLSLACLLAVRPDVLAQGSKAGNVFGGVVRLDKTVHDFGDILLTDGPVSATFTATNVGSKPMVIYNVVSSCGCTDVEWTKQPIKPGEKGTIKATYKNDEGAYPFDKNLTVYFSEPKQPVILRLRGESHAKKLSLTELYSVRFGDLGFKSVDIKGGNMSQGQQRSGEMLVANLGRKPLDVSFSDVTDGLALKLSQNPLPAGATAKLTYTVTAGGDGTWTRGSADGFTMTVKRSAADETTFSRFTGVTVDGKALSASDYEAAAGSLVLTLKAAYLETLSAGKHEITVSFDDGTAATSLTVREAGVPAPDTDDLSAGLWPILAILAVAGLALLPLKRRAA